MSKWAQVADHLKVIAQLLSLDGESTPFQVKAFEGASRTFRDLDYAADHGQDVGNWRAMPGIGASIRTTVDQFLATGTSDRYGNLANFLPAEAMSMTVVQGIGPKKAYKLWLQGTHNFAELSAKAYKGELDAALTEKVLQASKAQGRIPYLIAAAIAEDVRQKVLQVPGVLQAIVCGSIRRHTPTAKDIDIALSLHPGLPRAPMLEAFSHLGAGFEGGERKASMVIKGSTDIRCDLWLGEPYYYGSLLNHTTGSKEHNIRLRTLAASRGLTISEYGIFRGEERLGGGDEHDIYNVLGIPYVEPEDRAR